MSGDIILYIHVYHKWTSYDIGSLKCKVRQTKILSFWVIFCPFSRLTTQKIKILKLEKAPEDIIILHIRTIHYNHMIYVSWDMELDEQNFLSFWTVFCLFTSPTPPHPSLLLNNPKNQNSSLTAQKIKIKKKNEKKVLEISAFYNGVPKIMIICYTVPEILRITDVTVIFHFGLSFALLPS